MRTFQPVNDYVWSLFMQPLFKEKYADGLTGQRFSWSPGGRRESCGEAGYVTAETIHAEWSYLEEYHQDCTQILLNLGSI